MTDVGGIAAERLQTIVERIERLHDKQADLAEDVKEIFSEAKGAGFDAKTIKRVIKERKLDNSERSEAQMVFDLYWDAVHNETGEKAA